MYLHALLEHADQETRDRIEHALQPPVQLRKGNVPAWYGSDEDAWAGFQKELRKPGKP